MSKIVPIDTSHTLKHKFQVGSYVTIKPLEVKGRVLEVRFNGYKVYYYLEYPLDGAMQNANIFEDELK